MTGTAPNRAPFQLFLPMFLPHEEEVMRQAYAKRMDSKEKARIKYRQHKVHRRFTRVLDNISLSIFDLPLGPIEDTELSTNTDPYLPTDDDLIEALTDEKAMEGSDTAVTQLHDAMVTYSLRLLNARGNGREKKAILDWIFNPQRLAVARPIEGKDPRWEVINASEVPFGFDLCCRFAGYDAERIREGLVHILKQTDLAELFKEVEHERSTEQGLRAANVSSSINIQHSRGAGKSDDHGPEAGSGGGSEGRPLLRLRNRAPSGPDDVLGRRIQSTVDRR